jgi:hypothetical protein
MRRASKQHTALRLLLSTHSQPTTTPIQHTQTTSAQLSNPPPRRQPRRPQIFSYDFANPGPTAAASRFTQLVWLDTKKIGCARSTTCSWPTYVCYFEPAGNEPSVDWSTQVLPATKRPSGHESAESQLIAVQGVDRPATPPDFPRAFWARTDEPLPSGGAPFSAPKAQRARSAAVLSPPLQQALERTNTLR